MGLREKFMVKQVYGNTDLELKAADGKSLLVKDIFIYNPSTSYLTVKIEKTTVGYFRVSGTLGSHLPLPMGSLRHSHAIKVAAADGSLTEDHALSDAFGVGNAHIAVFSDRSAATEEADIVQLGAVPFNYYQTILSLLASRGLFAGYPIAEGQTMTFSGAKNAAGLQAVIYEEYDAGDMKDTMPNGAKSDDYFFINYGRVAAAISTSGSTIYDKIQSPPEFPDFPFGKDVPAKMDIELHGILASDAYDNRSATDHMNTEYLKLVRERVTLFDDDKQGLLVKGLLTNFTTGTVVARGLSLIGNFSDIDGKPPLFFDPPLLFNPGEELGIYVTTIAGSSVSASAIAAADLEIGLIERVKIAG